MLSKEHTAHTWRLNGYDRFVFGIRNDKGQRTDLYLRAAKRIAGISRLSYTFKLAYKDYMYCILELFFF